MAHFTNWISCYLVLIPFYILFRIYFDRQFFFFFYFFKNNFDIVNIIIIIIIIIMLPCFHCIAHLWWVPGQQWNAHDFDMKIINTLNPEKYHSTIDHKYIYGCYTNPRKILKRKIDFIVIVPWVNHDMMCTQITTYMHISGHLLD